MTPGTWEIKILQIASSGSLILGAMIPTILYAKRKTFFWPNSSFFWPPYYDNPISLPSFWAKAQL